MSAVLHQSSLRMQSGGRSDNLIAAVSDSAGSGVQVQSHRPSFQLFASLALALYRLPDNGRRFSRECSPTKISCPASGDSASCEDDCRLGNMFAPRRIPARTSTEGSSDCHPSRAAAPRQITLAKLQAYNPHVSIGLGSATHNGVGRNELKQR